ncbi:unnamed protein product [Paramecium sonneborni]|uniref:Histone acetyl transferase HAT1 N-terminal domain-containing protein n=1 Tax=Paramecium sonneborni TaxID=65129 RepID=A0A8S1NBW5_9CILI|nr:unnamed protein product [Paramecium sonneborni]
MANLFDEEQGKYLRLNALKYLEKPPEVQREDDPFITNGSLAITYILVETVEQYQAGQGLKFQPSYVHQVFRSTNEIYGYKDLKITIHVTALGLKPYIQISYSEQTEDADDLIESFNKVYEAGFLSNEEQFIKVLEEEQNQQPLGELIEEYGDFKIYKCQMATTNGFVQFKPFLQAFLLVLIDGVQYPGDENEWVYLILYHKRQFVGLTTVYKFNISWNQQRHRLSQMLFLPQYQRKGHGSRMLRTVYKLGLEDEKCLQITLEDPSEDFQVMRDITDSKILYEHFKDIIPNQIINSVQDIVDIPKDKLFEIMKKTKLHAYQIKRAYSIYLYAFINKKSSKLMTDFAKFLLREHQKPYIRKKNILVRFEDGTSMDPKQLHLLELKEREDRNIIAEESLGDEFCLFELIATKLRKDKII